MKHFNRPAGSNIIDLRNYLPANYQPERVLGLEKFLSDDFITPYFIKVRRGQGDGLFCVRIYDEDGKLNPFMSGVTYETKTGDPDRARTEHQMELANELTVFYESKAYGEVRDPADICTLRQGYMSFLAVKCRKGVVAAGWYDTKSRTSANGIHMLAFILYTLGLMNVQDEVLKSATITSLPYADGVSGDFDVDSVQRWLLALAADSSEKKRWHDGDF